MIDEKEILPFNFFSYGGVYSGDHNGMRYMIKRTGKKPDFTLNALVWRGPYASSAVNADDITKKEFEYSEEGRTAAIEWIQKNRKFDIKNKAMRRGRTEKSLIKVMF